MPAYAENTDISTIGDLKPNGIRHVTVQQAHQLIIYHPEIIILDVRTKGEYKSGHIKGAKNINYFSLSFKKRIEGLDPSKTYLIHCKSGHRSGRAAPIMRDAGISAVLHMDGGFDAWKEAGLPIAKPE